LSFQLFVEAACTLGWNIVNRIVTVIGGCHLDRTIQLTGSAIMGRTNSGTCRHSFGGVAANIAAAMVSMCEAHIAVNFVGAAAQSDLATRSGITDVNNPACHQPENTLSALGVPHKFARIKAPPPCYTAILDKDGELLIGVADMELYDLVQPCDIWPLLPQKPASVMVDANFPASTLATLVGGLADKCRLFGAGTSSEKVQRLAPLLCRLDGLVLNLEEASALADSLAIDGVGVAELAARLALRLRVGGCVLISDGGDRAALALGKTLVEVDPPKVTLKNVNGAGDVMAGVFFRLLLDREWWLVDTIKKPKSAELKEILTTALAAGAAFAAKGWEE
jgi:pseudouridine kinase